MKLNNYEDYQLDLLMEAILTKDCPLYFSDRFNKLIFNVNIREFIGYGGSKS